MRIPDKMDVIVVEYESGCKFSEIKDSSIFAMFVNKSEGKASLPTKRKIRFHDKRKTSANPKLPTGPTTAILNSFL